MEAEGGELKVRAGVVDGRMCLCSHFDALRLKRGSVVCRDPCDVNFVLDTHGAKPCASAFRCLLKCRECHRLPRRKLNRGCPIAESEPHGVEPCKCVAVFFLNARGLFGRFWLQEFMQGSLFLP